jgi:phage-related protein
MYAIGTATGGAASTAANTAQGQFKRLSVSLQETKESIGAALLPAVNAVLPVLASLGNFASENTTAFLAVAGVIGTLAGIILAYNAYLKLQAAYTIAATVATAAFNLVMALNPIALVVIAVVALIAGLVLAYKKFEGFRNIVDSVFKVIQTVVSVSISVIKGYFETLYGFYKGIFNGIASLWNNTIGKLSFKVPSWVPGLGGKGFDVPNIPMLAEGGIVTSATLAMIGERGPEAVIPLDRMGQMGGNNVTIHVNGGDPQSVVDALRTYMFRNGSVPIRISG